jgi:hypothetical protein
MAQTNRAWDWGVELRDDERSELELLRGTVAQLRGQLAQARDSLRVSRQRDRTHARHSGSSTKPGRGAGVACGRRCATANCCSPHLTRPVVAKIRLREARSDAHLGPTRGREQAHLPGGADVVHSDARHTSASRIRAPLGPARPLTARGRTGGILGGGFSRSQ